jgi:hypothetical protein
LPAEGSGIVDNRATKATQVRHDYPYGLVLQTVDYTIPGTQAVGKSVEQDEREMLSGAVLFVFDAGKWSARERHSRSEDSMKDTLN